MKMFVASIALLLACGTLSAQSKSITVWPKGVPPGDITKKVDFGDHILSVSHRDSSGKVEIHLKKADVLVIQSGSATFLSGGKAINAKPSAPDELLGDSIQGGTKVTVGPGAVIEVPVGLPHQFILAPGTQITYLVVKIVKQ